MMGYIGLVIPESVQQRLLKQFPPMFPNVYCHHVTEAYGVDQSKMPDPEPIPVVKIVGFVHDERIQVALVTVNGKDTRPDGRTYHITWSIDKEKGATPALSNQLIASGAEVTPVVGTVEFRSTYLFFPR